MKKISHGCTLDCADCCKFNVYVKNDDIILINLKYENKTLFNS